MMQYEKCFELRAADFDRYDNVRPSSVLSLFQDVAGIHANELGIGFTELMARQTIWVLTKVRYRMVGRLQRYETVRVRTWPLPPARINFRREYCIEALDGTPLVHGTSEWVIVHSEKRRVLPATNVYPEGEDYRTDTEFEGRLAKVPQFEAVGEGRCVVPSYTQLDINGHINNTCYADFVMDALSPAADTAVTGLQIDYHRELMAGQRFTLHLHREGEVLLSCGSAEGERMFSCRLQLAQE